MEMTLHTKMQARLSALDERIAEALAKAGRTKDSLCVIAVSKERGPEELLSAYEAGFRDFGENYVQEFLRKKSAVETLAPHAEMRWHMIGHIQRRKAKDVIGQAQLIHSVDSLALLKRLERRCELAGIEQDVLLQYNMEEEASKNGFAPEAFEEILEALEDCPRLRLRGIMGMAPYDPDGAKAQGCFAKLRKSFGRWQESSAGAFVDTLSMGMSHELEWAIYEGATHLRIGTAIFGPREA